MEDVNCQNCRNGTALCQWNWTEQVLSGGRKRWEYFWYRHILDSKISKNDDWIVGRKLFMKRERIIAGKCYWSRIYAKVQNFTISYVLNDQQTFQLLLIRFTKLLCEDLARLTLDTKYTVSWDDQEEKYPTAHQYRISLQFEGAFK